MIKDSLDEQSAPKHEWLTFLFIIVAMFPALAIALVGSYGFIIWMSQILIGPPGHG